MSRMYPLCFWGLAALLVVAAPVPAPAAEPETVRILLLGDSTTIGSVCRQVDPDGPHLEDVIRRLLAAETDLPPAEVINQGRDGEVLHGLLTSGRYDKENPPLKEKGFDYVIIRYGLNDLGKR